MKDERVEVLHYKNGLFQGVIADARKQGEAICLYDAGAVLVGRFTNDQLAGQAVMLLSPDSYFIGNFKRGMLDGPFVLRTPQHAIYARTNMNKIEGEIVVIERNGRMARVWEIEQSEGVCIREGEYDESSTEQRKLRAVSPYTTPQPGLLEHFVLNISNRFSIRTSSKDRLEVAVDVKALRRLTLHFHRERLVAAGLMEEGLIYGLGYTYDPAAKIEAEGEMQRSQLHGQGLKRQPSGKAIFGKFSRGDIRTLESASENGELAESGLLKLKRKIHMHSLQYTNDYLNERPVFLLRNFLQSIIENENNYDRFLREGGRGAPRTFSVESLSRQASSEELTYSIKEYNLIKQALRGSR